MDDIDKKQQEEIEALKEVDIDHWKELWDLGHTTLWIQRTFSLIFIWLFVITIIVGVLLFHKYTLEVSLVPN